MNELLSLKKNESIHENTFDRAAGNINPKTDRSNIPISFIDSFGV